jgi:ribosomal protein S17
MFPVSFPRHKEFTQLIQIHNFSDVEIGDVVTVGECRPLSKTVKFNVLKINKVAGAKKKFQKF